MFDSEKVLTFGFMNIHGQTGLNSAKQNQIENFIVSKKIDVLNLQCVHAIGH